MWRKFGRTNEQTRWFQYATHSWSGSIIIYDIKYSWYVTLIIHVVKMCYNYLITDTIVLYCILIFIFWLKASIFPFENCGCQKLVQACVHYRKHCPHWKGTENNNDTIARDEMCINLISTVDIFFIFILCWQCIVQSCKIKYFNAKKNYISKSMSWTTFCKCITEKGHYWNLWWIFFPNVIKGKR